MGKILRLPEDVAIKIAAGEVVERPASAIKELIENSIDAGATEINITLADGGKTLIEIHDNGCGMDESDAVNAFWRHGTSKISTLDDLQTLATLGFRGEALAAIAASGEGELTTSLPAGTQGTLVAFRFGEIGPAKPNAPIGGTKIIVKNLFAALPARQKFLKSKITEWKSSYEIISKQAISHPEVAFSLTHNNRQIFVLSDQSFPDRVAAIWRLDANKLLAVESEIPHYRLSGVVGKPELAHEHKGKQFLAVNNHPVSDKMITKAVREAFGTLLPTGVYPVFALKLGLHPGMVDVNIHPRKDEVRFINGQEIFRFVTQAISQVVEKQNLAFTEIRPDSSTYMPSAPQATRPTISPSPKLDWTPTKHPPALNHQPLQNWLGQIVPARNEEQPRPIIVIDNCFLVAQHESNLLIVDQHAAHERILFHQLEEQENARALTIQPLLLPAKVTLAPDQLAKIIEHHEEFARVGFELIVGDDYVELVAVPQLLKTQQPERFLINVLESVDETKNDPDLTTYQHRLLATMACKAAVKAGDVLTQAEQQRLIADLLALPDRFTCPHGRPSYIEIKPGELEKLFKRTGF